MKTYLSIVMFRLTFLYLLIEDKVMHAIDKFDHYVLDHRWHWLCCWIANTSWHKDSQKCQCNYCNEMRKKFDVESVEE